MSGPSRWGSFLSQAVAGVEARLDNILADPTEDTAGKQKDAKPASPAPPSKPSPSPSRTSSTRTNDRLQERLARAMAAKSAGRSSMSNQGSPRQSLDSPNTPSTDAAGRASPGPKEPTKDTPSPRSSQDIMRKSGDGDTTQAADKQGPINGETEAAGKEDDGKSSIDSAVSGASQPQSVPAMEAPSSQTQAPERTTVDDTPSEDQRKDETKAEDVQHQQQQQQQQQQHQEEILGYVERIDALEAKLQFLAREAAESARKAALAAPAGSLEKKLAEKDQQIAQLIEEGKNLASADHKSRALVKKLRSTIAEHEKELDTLRTAKGKSDKEVENLRPRARRADELEKANADLQRRLDQAQKELSTLRPEVRSKDSTIADLRSQLQKATEQADSMAARVNDKAREQDRRRIADLEEEVAALKVEKNLVADRGKAQAAELREKAERANERALARELELKAEMQVLEGKLEAMRFRAEEASSGAAGDSQAKLLRQIETLQTQYSIASSNWQGIETTLLARITGLERERDEALQRESDMRRKAREAATRAKRQEEELEEAKSKIPTIQQDVKAYQAQLDALKKRAEEAEAALATAKSEFEKEKQSWEAERESFRQQQQEVPERPRSWLDGLPGAPFHRPDSRPASPQLTAPLRTFSSDFLGITTPAGLSKPRGKTPLPSNSSDAGASSRRPSAQRPIPLHHSGPGSSGVFSSLSGVFSPVSEAPPIPSPSPLTNFTNFRDPTASPSLDRERELHRVSEDAFEEAPVVPDIISRERSESPAPSKAPSASQRQQQQPPQTPSQQQLQDMISVSTVAAGPSVQLVERMSAAIRRLESERVATKEELSRMTRQRDEARAEIVALMREVENGKASAQRVAVLEAEVAEVRQRYETTLELLGEKSEEVEELKADVEDVKAMYRDLVERTIK
ncbi:hypothetical protein VTJ49DRAFT_181 [Mycothermus thermophilus]|uniref:TATA element modulatory factor 1 TATA binding domain-containing protein n=1 Tax=Humicola insolens TaxID=85995 RepID=A0ABR3VG78_HUMIN